MKTHEQILERYLSPESTDIFSAQRIVLLCMLPFEMAKPYLAPAYVAMYENDTLPEEEKWVENYDVNKQILDFIPTVYKALDKGHEVVVWESLLALKGWIWAVDEEFHDVISPIFEVDHLDGGKELLGHIASHFGYVPSVEDVSFEEIKNDPEPEFPVQEEEEKNHLWEEEEEEASTSVREPYTSGTSKDEEN